MQRTATSTSANTSTSATSPVQFAGPAPATITFSIPAKMFYVPTDAAQALGINEDTVTHHIRQRPRLFPGKTGGRHEWTKSEFPGVLACLRSLSPRARKAK